MTSHIYGHNTITIL